MGCARISIELIVPSSEMQAGIENGAEIAVDVLDSNAEMSCDVSLYDIGVSTDIENGAEIDAYKATHADIIVSLVCAVDISGETVYYLRDVNQVPVLTVDGKYIFLSSTE